MKIKIGKYVISSNGRGYELYKPVKPGKDAKNQNIQHKNQQYYSALETLLKCAPERIVMAESDASTLAELLGEIRSYHRMIEMAINK